METDTFLLWTLKGSQLENYTGFPGNSILATTTDKDSFPETDTETRTHWHMDKPRERPQLSSNQHRIILCLFHEGLVTYFFIHFTGMDWASSTYIMLGLEFDSTGSRRPKKESTWQGTCGQQQPVMKAGCDRARLWSSTWEAAAGRSGLYSQACIQETKKQHMLGISVWQMGWGRKLYTDTTFLCFTYKLTQCLGNMGLRESPWDSFWFSGAKANQDSSTAASITTVMQCLQTVRLASPREASYAQSPQCVLKHTFSCWSLNTPLKMEVWK